jgi:anthranilate synthase
MTSALFHSPSGITVERRRQELPFEPGLDFLVQRLDAERGGYFSSGVEDPDRYSRWDFGFVAPPVELIGAGRRLAAVAHNPRGERLLQILDPLLTDDPCLRTLERSERRIEVEAERSDEIFPEEERSRQPSLFTPLRRLIADFKGIADGFLGLYGAFGYDLLFQFEQIALSQARDGRRPDLRLFLPDQLYLLDRRKESCAQIHFEFARDGLSTTGAGRTPFERLKPPAAEPKLGDATSDHAPEDYMAKVDAARERMRIGDVFEVVLSRKFSAAFQGAPSALFRLMQRVNPSPYEFFLQFGDEQLIGASPEMFVRVEGERVESSPISGTARRGVNAMEDAERIKALYNSEKDEVELTMCTDVDRNDKARICRPGSVKLLSRRQIERYAGLFHTVDHVEGRLREGFGGLDAFLSHMWAVTLTGAPKRMAARIIEETEASPRRWYGGAIGALQLNGDVNTGITIRTVHLEDGRADYRAGSTLVWDSIPAEEERETQLKSTAFFRAVESLGRRPTAAPAAPRAPEFEGVRIVMVDNEDSFVHTLADYFRQTGAEVKTYRARTPLARLLAERPDLVVHSPGPGRPADFGVPELIRALAERRIPQFGVCLGLQGMVEAFGGSLAVLPEPRHGKTWDVAHDGTGLFEGVPSPARVGAYHSLVAATVPEVLDVTARSESGLAMAVRHRTAPAAAVQFHPESILSLGGEVGHRIVRNVLRTLTAERARAAAE